MGLYVYEGLDQWVGFLFGWAIITYWLSRIAAKDVPPIIGARRIFIVANEGAVLAYAIFIVDVTGISFWDISDIPELLFHPQIFVTLLIGAAFSAIVIIILVPLLGIAGYIPCNGGFELVSSRDLLLFFGGLVGSAVCVVFTWIIGGPLNFEQGVGYVVILTLCTFTVAYGLICLKKLF